MMERFARFQCRAWPERLFQIARKDSAAERDDQTEFESCCKALPVAAILAPALRRLKSALHARSFGGCSLGGVVFG